MVCFSRIGDRLITITMCLDGIHYYLHRCAFCRQFREATDVAEVDCDAFELDGLDGMTFKQLLGHGPTESGQNMRSRHNRKCVMRQDKGEEYVGGLSRTRHKIIIIKAHFNV